MSFGDGHSTQDDASQLCLSCGLCCEGVLHENAVLPEEEFPMAADLRLTVVQRRDYTGFALPCTYHVDGACSTYDYRPSTCGAYSCKLLRELNAGEVLLEDALRVVDETRRHLDTVYQAIGGRDRSQRVWSQASAFLRAQDDATQGDGPVHDAAAPIQRNSGVASVATPQMAALLLNLKLLAIRCGRHFEPSNFGHHAQPSSSPMAAE